MSLKKLLFFGIIIASVFIINSLIRSIYTLWQKNHLITVAKNDLEKQKKENNELKMKLAEVKKPEFIEEEARNKLFLGKTDEKVITLPTAYLKANDSSKTKKQDSQQNWKKWLELFF